MMNTVIGIALVLLAVACGTLLDSGNSVSGSVTYRERVALSPGARLEVQLRDVSYQDAAAPLIAEQVIHNPGQVPIEFKIEYDQEDIESRNAYSVQATIYESDGRMAFTNDTAYDVITRGNTRKVDMLLVMVQPPPDASGATPDLPRWVETQVPIMGARLVETEPEIILMVDYLRSTVEGCGMPGNQRYELEDSHIVAEVTLMTPPDTPWGLPCDEDLIQVEDVVRVTETLTPGQTYVVSVNGRHTTAFTLPEPDFGDSIIAQSPIERIEIVMSDGADTQFQLRVVSELPKGSSCSRFNGYEIRRTESNRIDVNVTHHEVADPFTECTADLPIVETFIPLGSEFEDGQEYTVTVNSEHSVTFEG
ncbi:MAG: hypothetical protein F4X94_01465 [Dehalococcoidia bacterium]|nr:hypothetical protein [Dehalococcoidia bacterium]